MIEFGKRKIGIMIITVLTPSFNRKKKLEKLYSSLCNQKSQSFEWLIIDDGSTDDTKALVDSWRDTAPFSIKYVNKENGGKHTALNLGISMISSELTFIVDSDDYLTENAIETILEFHEKYKDRIESEKLCGYSFLRAYSDGMVNTGKYPVDEVIDTFRQQRINNNLLGDKAEVYYTKILKQFPFEVFEGEKFMPEDAVWLKMSGPYNMVHANRVIYICDYLEGGLTKTGRKMKIYSPYGMMYRSAVYLNDPDVKLKVKMKMMILYHIYLRFANRLDAQNEIASQVKNEKREKCKICRNWLFYVTMLPA